MKGAVGHLYWSPCGWRWERQAEPPHPHPQPSYRGLVEVAARGVAVS